MKHVIIHFTVKQDKIEEARQLIRAFIAMIKQNEPNTLMYRSFAEESNPGAFVHIMSFKDEEAQALHKQTDYCKTFVKKLYPICSDEPVPKEYTEV